jgi:NADH:ubiquinone reductase (H+-translocating)
MNVVVLGGGYAGLACLARLSRVLPRAERVLVEPFRWHLRRTLLHETIRKPLSALRADLAPIARRWGFRHHRGEVDWSVDDLVEWSQTRRLRVGSREIPFDALVLATGLPGVGGRVSRNHVPPVPLESLATGPGVRAYKRLAAVEGRAWVVGAGASGLQCLFELAAARPPGAPLGLIEAGESILPTEPEGLRRDVLRRLDNLDLDLRLGTFYAGYGRGRVRMESAAGQVSEPADGVLLCTGPRKARIEADASGRVLSGGQPLPGLYAAGDCAYWSGVRFDAATAQTAVRKGRHVATTVARVAAGREPSKWRAQQLGFFMSLGPRNAVGWAFRRGTLITGRPALAAREAIEARWDLLLRGFDSFAAL